MDRGVTAVLGFGLWWGLRHTPEVNFRKPQAINSAAGVLPKEEDCPTLDETPAVPQHVDPRGEEIPVFQKNEAPGNTTPRVQSDAKIPAAPTRRTQEDAKFSTTVAANATAPVSILQALPGLPFEVWREWTLPSNEAPVAADLPAIQPADRRCAWRGGAGMGVQLGGLPTHALPGIWAGGVIQGKLLEKWGWTAGLQYAVMQITPEEVGRTAQTTLGFGATNTQYVSEARSAHQLAAPVGVFRRMGRKVQLEAGALLSYRLALRGVVNELTYPKPWERTAQEDADYLPRLSSYFDDQAAGLNTEFPLAERSTVYARGWLEPGSKNAFSIQPYIGVQYNIGARFTLTGRVAYPGTVSLGAFYWLR
ncbi:MAG: hypothetical protein IPJ40_18185 [Saprospirales bacterium]|nr:hypothetical protein [Saprospirales bacterium]